MALFVIGVLYLLVFIVPRVIREHRRTPTQELATFRAAVDENNLVISGFVTLDGSDISANQALVSLRSSLSKSDDKLTEILRHPTKQINSLIVGDLSSTVTQEKQLMTEYDSRYAIFAKPMAYNPEDDLGKLSIGGQPTEVMTRADAANKALKTLADTPAFPLKNAQTQSSSIINASNSFMISDDARQSLVKASDCFASLSQTISSKNYDLAAVIRSQCVSTYRETRKQITLVITEPFRSDTGQKVLSSVKAIVVRVDNQLKSLKKT